jgi:methyltransferase (TIGR00027 family)
VSEPLVRHVSDTAHWVAYYRATESDRRDALFHDPFARRLAGERGARIARSMQRHASWPMAVRTRVLDEMILHLVGHEGVDLVLSLAAGLDARPWRLALPPALRWIEADLPGVLDYKHEALAGETPVCALEAVRLDLTDVAARRALLARVGGSAANVLVLTEGLLVYLAPEDVAALAQDLAAVPSIRWWILDILSPRLLAMLEKRIGDKLREAPFRFAPREGTAFFRRFGWTEAEFRSMWTEADRLHRLPPYAWTWKLLAMFASPERRAALRRMSGFVRLERAAAAG